MKVGVIGAGAAGLAAARNLLAEGFEVEVLERDAELGGVWNYGRPPGRVYRSTHMISSKPFTQFPDFPMPDAYPDYPHHAQVLEYLRAYARRFGVVERIRFGADVVAVEPSIGARAGAGAGGLPRDVAWSVRTADGATRVYGALVIANGHNWLPKLPELPGEFEGEALHSAEYRTPDVFEGRRVLVVGAGNSGCDIAVEAAQVARATSLSMRRGYHYVPKYLLGRPVDQIGDLMLRLRIPLRARRWIARQAVRLASGTPERVGLPEPDHALFETHPIVNTLLPYYVQHGRITPRADVARLEGERVRYADGTIEPIDVIVYATGYRLAFPFLDEALLNWRDGRPYLHQLVFHPALDTLFVAGMIQTDSGVFGLVHWQTRAIALFLRAVRDGSAAAERMRARKTRVEEDYGAGIRYAGSTRHLLEVEHWSYLKGLRRLVGEMEC